VVSRRFDGPRRWRAALAVWVTAIFLPWSGAGAQVPAPAAAPLKLPAELPAASGYATLDALPGISFQQPLCLVVPPGETARLFVVEKTGQIAVLTGYGTHPQKQTFLDVPAALALGHAGTLATESEMGVLGLAFHPHFATNGYFYVAYDVAIEENGTRKLFDCLARFHVPPESPNAADPASGQLLITQLDHAGNHNGGDVHFGADGYLYFSNGDEGAGNDHFNNARLIDKDFFAAIFRLDVDQKPGSLAPHPHQQDSQTWPSAVHTGTYRIPPDNPFINRAEHSGRRLEARQIRTEIWATGLRNAWRFSFDPPTGRMFIGDVGQNLWEEVDLGVAGGDYGWSYYEGTHSGPRLKTKPPGLACIDPIYEYGHGHDLFTGDCVIGGMVYRGSRLSELYGAYIFGDFDGRHIWALRDHGGKWQASYLATDGQIAAFGLDPRNGDVLMAHYAGGKIKRLVRTGTSGVAPPALLSQTGAFTDVARLVPDPALVPFAPRVSFWSDYAQKSRWFALPDASARITFSQDGNWGLPTGMVWVKHFDMEMRRGDPSSCRRLETRFLVKTTDGIYGLTYKWRPDQSDADLVPEGGQDEVLNIAVAGATHQQTWHYPGRAECLTCHTNLAGVALGFNTRQLNGPGRFGTKTLNQIEALSAAGYFTAPVSDRKDWPALAAADDASAPLEARVRSYLAVNCVQCHQPGAGSVGLWDARPTVTTAQAHLIRGALVNDGGDAANRWAVPGDVAHSMVLKRLRGQGIGRMPPLATNELDPGAAALLTQWIEQLQP